MAQAPIIFGQLPLNYCWPSNPQTFLNDVAQIIYAAVQDNITGVFYGPTDPGADTKLWFNTNNGRLYEWNSTYGLRTSLYFPAANAQFRMLWEGTEAELIAMDNPSLSATVTQISGPFWTIDHNYDGRSPMGPGAISGEDPIVKTLAVLENYGTGSHIQLATEVAQHTHIVEHSDATVGATYSHVNTGDAHPFDGSIDEPLGVDAAGANQASYIARASLVAATAMQNVHPVRGAYVIKRTSRVYYTLP